MHCRYPGRSREEALVSRLRPLAALCTLALGTFTGGPFTTARMPVARGQDASPILVRFTAAATEPNKVESIPPQKTHASGDLIGYKLLATEFEATGQSMAEYQSRLDRLKMLSSQALEKFGDNPDFKSEAGVKKVLGSIDSVLAENDYQIWIPTASLWDTLARSKEERGLPYSTAMRRRVDQEGGRFTAKYVFDCDTGSMIYLHILEQINAPVCMVETKRHNFVRWRFSDTHYLNWDVNSGNVFTDDEYRRGGVGLSSGFTKEEEVAGGYLKDMSRDEVTSYHLALVAQLYSDRRDFDKAIATFKKCIGLAPNKALPRNNLAWMIAIEPQLQKPKLLDLALSEATKAVELRPSDGNLIDTLAAAYAARRDFANALKWEQSKYGNKNLERIAVYKEGIKTPAELGWK